MLSHHTCDSALNNDNIKPRILIELNLQLQTWSCGDDQIRLDDGTATLKLVEHFNTGHERKVLYFSSFALVDPTTAWFCEICYFFHFGRWEMILLVLGDIASPHE